MVCGDFYAADQSIYQRIKSIISQGINHISDIEFTKTKELGKVKKIDPLGITDLRIRGMWHITNPIKVFNYLFEVNNDHTFSLIVLMKKQKYFSFPQSDRDQIESLSELVIKDVNIKNPNNPAQLMEGKLITFYR